MNNLAVFDYNGQTISRRQNGFINLTQMCQANGKRLDVFMKAQKTKEYIDCLERSHQMVVTEIVGIKKAHLMRCAFGLFTQPLTLDQRS